VNFAGNFVTFTPYAFIETATPHGLWNVEGGGLQTVTIADVESDGGGALDIGPAVNGDHTVIVRTLTTFIFQSDDPEIADKTPAVNGTASVLFLQDPSSGNVTIKIDPGSGKSFGDDDSLVGKVLLNTFDSFWNAVIYHNTADTLQITQCFAPGAFGTPIADLQIMEQSAELLTTCSFVGAGSRRGDHRGGLTLSNCDSVALCGTKVTPLEEDQIGLCQNGGTLITETCHLTVSRFNDAQGAAMSQCTYMDNMHWKGSAVDLERCYVRNEPDPFLNGPINWFYAYFGTVFQNVSIGYDTTIESDFWSVKFYQHEGLCGVFFSGRHTWNGVSFEDQADSFIGMSGSAARARMINCNGNFLEPTIPATLSLNGGWFLINSNNGPYGDACFNNDTDFMYLDGLPDRTYADFRQHAVLNMGAAGEQPASLCFNLDTVFEAINPDTSYSPLEGRPGDQAPYPSITTVGDLGAGLPTVDYDDVTGLVTIHFWPANSTVEEVETAVSDFPWPDNGGIRVKTPGTAANVLAAGNFGANGDESGPTLLDLGVAGPCGQYTDIRLNPKTNLLDCPGALGTQSGVYAYTLPA